jgi:hypothetical protein
LLLARSARSSLKQARVVNGEVVIRTLWRGIRNITVYAW